MTDRSRSSRGLRTGDTVHVGHFGLSGMGTSALDASDPGDLRLLPPWRAPHGSHLPKVQVADGLLLVHHGQSEDGEPHSAGMAVSDLAGPRNPVEAGRAKAGTCSWSLTRWSPTVTTVAAAGFDDREWELVLSRTLAALLEEIRR